MTDFRINQAFIKTVAKTRATIDKLALEGSPDAAALVDRSEGVNNLQGHAHSLIPLAVIFAKAYPQLMRLIRIKTALPVGMGMGSQEARDPEIWDPVKAAMQQLIAQHSTDIIAEQMSSQRPQTIGDVANTYLSRDYGGSQTRGGAGNTVIKRTLKILAHTRRF